MPVDLEVLYETHAYDMAKSYIENTRAGIREHIDRFYEVAKVVKRLDPDSILDAPCGSGVLLDIVSQAVYRKRRVVGIDISDTNCSIVKKLYGYEALAMDLLNYYPVERFDLVMCMEILEHLHNSEIYVAKALSLSKKHVLFSVPVESGEVDGVFHVRKIHPTEITKWIKAGGGVLKEMWMVPSFFCEKPHWVGWLFALAEVPHE